MRRTDRLAEERDGRIPVARGPEQEIQRVTVGINAPVKIVPGPADTHVRLVDLIRLRGASQKWPAPLVDLRCIALHPSIDRRMVDTQAPLAHHVLEVAVTHGIPQVPPNTQEDESWFELTPFERIVAGHDGDPVQSLSKIVHPEVAGPKLQQNRIYRPPAPETLIPPSWPAGSADSPIMRAFAPPGVIRGSAVRRQVGSEHPGAVLFERHHLVIFRYFWRMTRRRDVAEDLTQDVFVRAVRGLGNYEPRNRDRAWLFEIARRLLLDHQRTTGRRGAMAELTDRDAATPPVQQLSVAIDQALDQLGEIDREVFFFGKSPGSATRRSPRSVI